MSQKKQRLLLGAHMSVAGGFEQAIARGESIGCTTIQIFTKSNRQWLAKPITQEQEQLFKAAIDNTTINPIAAHASYLINIASPDATTAQKSADALLDELNRCHQLAIPYLVFHPGSHTNSGQDEALTRIAAHINGILRRYTGTTMLLLENMAGQGSSTCSTFEQIAQVLSLVEDTKRVGVCFDTCHAFAAGYDFRTEETYQAMWTQFDATIGLQHLNLMHINDSKKGLGSRVDRHANIGEGLIGLEGFALLFNDERFFDIPKILETPKTDLAEDAKNMATLASLISENNRIKLGMD